LRPDGNAAKRPDDNSLGPWWAWKEKAPHLRAIKFIQTYCRAPKGKGFGKPLKLAKWQKDWLKEALSPDIDAAVMALPRGNGKSTFAAAIAVWATFDVSSTGAPQVPIVATTVGQAIRSVYAVAAAMVKAEPLLLSRCNIYTGIATPRITIPATGAEMFPIANDVDGLQGLDPSLAIVDEVGFQPIESWEALLLAQGKREQSLVMGLGTPGLDRENALWHLRSKVHEGAKLSRFLFREYAAAEDCLVDDRAAWREANPALAAGYLRESALETALGLSPEAYFRIFHLGQWVDGTDSWLGPNGRRVWTSLNDTYPLEPKAPTWVGIDIGLKHDSSAVVVVQLKPDGKYHARCHLWVPTKDEPVDTTDIMAYLRELDRDYELRAVSYDPRFFDVPAKYLSDEGLPMIEIPQSVERMTFAIGSTYEAIQKARLTHDPDEPFTTQVLNAIPRFNERGFTLQKAKSRGRIDAAIALSLAMERALWDAANPKVVPTFIPFD